MTSAVPLRVVSTDTSDNATDGVGARTVMLRGLDNDLMELNEVVSLNGTTPVYTTNSFRRIHRAYVLTAGSTGWNEGDINVNEDTAGSANLRLRITATLGQTLMAVYTIPKNMRKAAIASWGGAIRPGAAAANNTALQLWMRSEGGSWRLTDTLEITSNGGPADEVYHTPLPVSPGTDIKIRAIDTQAVGVVDAHFHIVSHA